MLDFGHSPIWKFDGDYLIDEDFPLIDNDTEINEICNKVTKLYSSYYEFNSHHVACWFNEEQEEKDKPIIRELINSLIKRLNKINNGFFEIENCLEEWLKE